ncbi:MAG: chlorite dismutase family protein [Alicyclobacillus herbarius]|uniref:chlorite dismutase family protein n=1 Tax=Alicyclobacillus herbarius TaxID=122960 RepID=UPI002355733D|nr:chlorite dismutase family protein [Alicyclobacillus herbarius]MCL6632065.1 chlorite dismutase family protein [Alicyclobacillus herbarius]
MDTYFTGHIGFSLTPEARAVASRPETAAAEWLDIFESFDGRVTLRGVYLTQGFRADTDLFLFMYSRDTRNLQELQLALRKTTLGRQMRQPWAFIGITLEAEFNRSHIPAFVRGLPPKSYLCFYPYIRTPEWYLLPADERRRMLAEHGMFGREFPGIQTNNVYSFGLGDYEWLLSFETDDLEALVRMVRRQREAQARAYTKHEWPFIVGRRVALAEAMQSLL